MASTYSDQLRLEKQADGENENTWGQIANKQFELLEEAIAGRLALAVGGTDVTLTPTDGDFDQARNMFLDVSGVLTDNVSLIAPATPKMYVIQNATTGAFALSVKTAAGVPAVIPQGEIQIAVCDGTDFGLVNGVPTVLDEATNSLQLGGVVAANYARKDQGTPTNQVFTKAQAVARVTLSINAGSVEVDASLSNAFRLVMTENALLLSPSDPYDGQVIRIIVKQTGAGSATLSYGSAYKFPGGIAPILSTGANKTDYLAFEYDGADSAWIGNILKDVF